MALRSDHFGQATGDIGTTADSIDTGQKVPGGVSSLVMGTLTLYWRFRKQFLVTSGLGVAAVMLPFLVSAAVGYDLRQVDGLQTAVVLAGAYFVVVTLGTVAGNAARSGSVSLWYAYRTCWQGMWFLLAAALGVAIVVAPPLLVPFVGVALTSYLLVRLSVAFEAAMIEHINPVAAIRTAWSLTRDRFWRTALEFVLPHLLLLGVGALFSLLPHPALAAVLTILALPAYAIFRVLAYLNLLGSLRLSMPRDLSLQSSIYT